jgi:hypothetical protein
VSGPGELFATRGAILQVETDTKSRAVQTNLVFADGPSIVLSVGATRHGGEPWPEPRTHITSLYLSADQLRTVVEELEQLFAEYARRFGGGS